MKYQCVKSFDVEKYDDDGFNEDETRLIVAGSIWERDMSDNRIIGGEVKLDNPKTLEWLEISFDTFERYFRQVDED